MLYNICVKLFQNIEIDCWVYIWGIDYTFLEIEAYCYGSDQLVLKKG